MEAITLFFQQYGLALSIIAVLGVAVLGFLKYTGAFKKVAENVRHYLYLAISIGLSCIATAVYLVITKQFDISYYILIVGAVYALNQTFYNIFKVTSLNDLMVKILDYIKSLLVKKQ